jgi:hypothetical protein
MIEIKQYFEHPNRDFAGNPLATYMPWVSRDALRAVMTSPLHFDVRDLEHDWELRMTYPMRLSFQYTPQDNQLDFAQRLYALVQQGVRLRNPLAPSAAASFYAMCDSIVQGKPKNDDRASFLDSPWCAVLIGTPGTGKSATANALLRVLGPELFWHSRHGQLFQLLSLHVQAPTGSSGKTLAKEVFLKLRERARETSLPMPFISGRIPDTRAELEHAIEVLAKKLNLGVLVLDELQHLFRGTGVMDEDAMEFLTGVVNKLQIPLLLIGTWKAAGLLALEARLGRRAVSPASARFYRMPKDENWDAMVSLVLQHQYTLKHVQFSPGLSERLYHHTQGIHDALIKLMVIAQMEAIASGVEELSLTLIERVALEHLELIAPVCRLLRGERQEDDPELWDVEPVDFTKYVKDLNAKLQLRAAALRKRTVAKNARTVTVDAVADSITAVGAASPEVAQALADASVSEAPARSASDHVVSILEAAKVKGPRPTKSQKRQQETDRSFEALDDDDLRKIVYLAHRRGVKAEAALDAAGMICRPLEELTV